MPEMTIQQAFDFAVQHHIAGRLSEAESIYRQLLSVAPNHADSLHYLGLAAHQMGRNEAAADLVRKALVLQPEKAEVHNNLGNILRELGHWAESAACCREAVRLKPDYPLAHNNLGLAVHGLGKFEEAVAAFGRAIALQPDYHEAHNNLGMVLHEMGKVDQAIGHYRQAIAIQPDYPLAWNNLGAALRENGQPGEAVTACRRAIFLRPDLFQAHNNLGAALMDQGRIDEAISTYRQALSLRPDLPEAHNNLGNALKDAGEIEPALAALRQALQYKPDFVAAHSNLLFSLNYHEEMTDAAITEEHRQWSRLHAEPLRRLISPHENEHSPDRRLRVGYVSPDFREHSVAYFLEGLLENHDPNRVEVFCYSDVGQPDSVTSRLRAHAKQWREILGMADEQVAGLIRADGIDILVDLAGHTARNRLPVFARRPAPVQVTWLGYSNTTGLDCFACRITDPIADPPGRTENLHSERLVRLPKTFACFRPMNDSPPIKPGLHANHGWVTFGSFHTLAKLNDRLLGWWAEILGRVPHSRLLLVAAGLEDPTIQERLIVLFRRRGIDAERLQFKGKLSPLAYLELHHEIDLLLDSHPFSGHTVACHALWMGVPVVTLPGLRHCSRMVASVLSNLGHPEWIAANPEEYVKIAVGLARDLPRLERLRSSLRTEMTASPLLDAKAFASDMEAAYRALWREWCDKREDQAGAP